MLPLAKFGFCMVLPFLVGARDLPGLGDQFPFFSSAKRQKRASPLEDRKQKYDELCAVIMEIV